MNMKVDLEGRVALVTGGAGAIGRSIALALAENGATVAVNDLRDAGTTCDEIQQKGGKAKFFPAGISSSAAVDTMVSEIEKDLGAIEILINNAGVNVGKNRVPVHEFPDSEWDRIVSIDLNGTFYCSRAVSGRMVTRNKGSIVNISSVLGIVPARLQCAFTAAKAGVVNFTRAHALEVGQYGIRVNCIAPGSILTEGTKSIFYSPENKQRADSMIGHIPLGKPGETEDVAAAVLFLVSDDAKYVTGHTLVVDGGWTAGFSRDW
jgi:NAD(P)-dependent dehydrogenase (short-subunit alcohol dehydrogenase family)